MSEQSQHTLSKNQKANELSIQWLKAPHADDHSQSDSINLKQVRPRAISDEVYNHTIQDSGYSTGDVTNLSSTSSSEELNAASKYTSTFLFLLLFFNLRLNLINVLVEACEPMREMLNLKENDY